MKRLGVLYCGAGSYNINLIIFLIIYYLFVFLFYYSLPSVIYVQKHYSNAPFVGCL